MEKRIVFFLFDDFTALDVIGPYEILSKLPNSIITFAGKESREYKDRHGLVIKANYSIKDILKADVLVIPGGFGIDPLLFDEEVLEWLRKISASTKWTVSVCSGSLLLAEAGILNNKKCTTHWRRKEKLKKYNVTVEDKRYTHDGKIITSAGVSAGIDMALYLTSLIENENFAKAVQLSIEYDPQPPFDCGSPEKAPKALVDKLK